MLDWKGCNMKKFCIVFENQWLIYWVAQTFVSRINFSDTHCFGFYSSTKKKLKYQKIFIKTNVTSLDDRSLSVLNAEWVSLRARRLRMSYACCGSSASMLNSANAKQALSAVFACPNIYRWELTNKHCKQRPLRS